MGCCAGRLTNQFGFLAMVEYAFSRKIVVEADGRFTSVGLLR